MSFPNPTLDRDVLVEVTGTIVAVDSLQFDPSVNQYIQKVILTNANAVNHVITIPDRVLIMVRLTSNIDPIPFHVNDPITVKGFFKRSPTGFLSYMHKTHAPSGYIRYNGKVYR